MNYLLLKYFHIVCTATSFALFFIRGVWALRGFPPNPDIRVRMLPHVVDTLLLASGAGLVVLADSQNVGSWLQVKLVLLVVYVWLALVALRLGRSRGRKAAAWVSALIVFLFMTTVAVLHSPLGILSLL